MLIFYTGQNQAAPSPAKPTASFMPKVPGTQHVATDSSDDEAFDVDGPDIEWVENPPKSSQSVSTRLRRTVIDDDDDDDDEPIVAPPSTRKRARSAIIRLDSEVDDDDDDDDDDAPLVPASSKRRSRPAFIELEDSDDSGVSPAKRQRTSVNTPGRLKRPVASASSPTKPKAHKGHRSEKQKKMELLRRRRAGEKIDKLTSSEDDSDEEKRGLYDTDSEEEFNVLKEFDDDDEEVDEAPVQIPHKKSREKPKRQGGEDDSNDNDLDDFVTDDDDAPLGAPADLDIPLEFTSQAIRPLKDQFPYAIEWLIHRRINPTFERNDPVYSNAWRKLDDEVRALASSKFASSAWKAEFYRALKGRPKLDAYEMDAGERSGGLHDSCDACGRRNHPATFRVIFHGHPYYKNTLDDVESESSDSEEDGNDSDASGHASVDTQGMALPPATKVWYVGSVCCGNAETASSLIHWKHALKQWVDERLEDDGWMKPEKLYEREHMKAKKRRRVANEITDAWRENGIITALYRDFKATLEDARNKGTTGRNRGRFGR